MLCKVLLLDKHSGQVSSREPDVRKESLTLYLEPVTDMSSRWESHAGMTLLVLPRRCVLPLGSPGSWGSAYPFLALAAVMRDKYQLLCVWWARR